MAVAAALNRIGPQGQPGTDGIDGGKWLTGVSEPQALLGVNGDWYLDYKKADIYNKTDGVWIWQLNIKGKDGKAGKAGKSGNIGRDGTTKIINAGSFGARDDLEIVTPFYQISSGKILNNDFLDDFNLINCCSLPIGENSLRFNLGELNGLCN